MYPIQFENDINYTRHHILYHERKNVVFFLTPKCGNTSIKKAILNSLGYDFNYEYPAGFTFLSPKNVSYLKSIKPITTIGFVRNPYDRVKSCWKNKIKGTPETANLPIEGSWDDRFYTGMSFNEFISVLEETPWDCMDMHAREMFHGMSYKNEFLVDNVFKLEELTEDIMEWERLGSLCANFGMQLPALEHHNKTTDFFDPAPDIKQRISRLYARDFSFFDYQVNT